MPFYNNYAVSGDLFIGIWIYRNGAWSLFTTEYVGVYQVVYQGGVQQVTWDFSSSYAFGAGVTDIGVTIESHDGQGAGLTVLSINWSASAASGERSATPSGQQAPAVVRP